MKLLSEASVHILYQSLTRDRALLLLSHNLFDAQRPYL